MQGCPRRGTLWSDGAWMRPRIVVQRVSTTGWSACFRRGCDDRDTVQARERLSGTLEVLENFMHSWGGAAMTAMALCRRLAKRP